MNLTNSTTAVVISLLLSLQCSSRLFASNHVLSFNELQEIRSIKCSIDDSKIQRKRKFYFRRLINKQHRKKTRSLNRNRQNLTRSEMLSPEEKVLRRESRKAERQSKLRKPIPNNKERPTKQKRQERFKKSLNKKTE